MDHVSFWPNLVYLFVHRNSLAYLNAVIDGADQYRHQLHQYGSLRTRAIPE